MRTRYRKIVFIAFVLAAALSLQAQSLGNGQRMDNSQLQQHPAAVLLTAKLDEGLSLIHI